MPTYAPSPAIPPGLDPGDWDRVIQSAAREVTRLVAKAQRNGTLGVGDASRFGSLVTTLRTLNGLTPTEAKISAAALGPMMQQMTYTLNLLVDALPDHATAAVDDLTQFLGAAGQAKVGNPGAVAATAARTAVDITHDWTRLAASTQQGVVDAITTGMAGGLNPKEVAARIVNQGGLTHARAVTIARTEMADLYDASRMGWMRDSTDVVDGWWWRARPDACPLCQIMHGEKFTTEQSPYRHHNCRCVMVPIPAGEPLPPQAKPRDRDTIVNMLPRSWQANVPTDLRSLVSVRDNPGWRPSRVLRGPAVRTPIPRPTPKPKTPKPTTKVAAKAAPVKVPKQKPTTMPTMDGTPPTLVQAIKQTNPKHGKKGYTENCTRCVVAGEARVRGNDVTAGSCIGGDIARQVGVRTFGYDSVGKWQVGATYPNLARKDMLASGAPDGARFWVRGRHPKGGGHIWMAERQGDRIVFLDPQNGLVDDPRLEELVDLHWLRVDNLKFDQPEGYLEW